MDYLYLEGHVGLREYLIFLKIGGTRAFLHADGMIQ